MSRFLQEAFNYSHAEFDKSFSKIFTSLNDFLLSEKKAAFLQKRMQKEGQTFFAQIKELGESESKTAWLAVETKLSPEEAVKLIPSQLKIAPKSRLSSIVVSATHGINCVCSITPKTIQEMPGVFYFKLASDSKLWKDLCEESEIGIYSPIALQISSIDVLIEG
jgi:predicted component of type VI protein secretion system